MLKAASDGFSCRETGQESALKRDLKSAIYKGQLRHRRFQPKAHDFTYDVFMVYLDLDEIDVAFQGSSLWSVSSRALARFSPTDFFLKKKQPLAPQIRQYVLEEKGIKVNGAVRMLANLRYFGYIFNPLVCYYCFDEHEKLLAIVAEVTNTPWKEKHIYVLPCDPNQKNQTITFNKQFHVSPFQPMNTFYKWNSTLPDNSLGVHMQSFMQGTGMGGDGCEQRAVEPIGGNGEENCFFDATLTLNRVDMTPASLRQVLLGYPVMTLKVMAAIYWQALKLVVKRFPFYSHPKN